MGSLQLHTFCVFTVLLLYIISNIQTTSSIPQIKSPFFPRVTGGQNHNHRFENEKGKYYQGDIVLHAEALAGSYSPRWARGIIPYAMHPNIRNNARQAISRALKDIEEKTCIRFKPRKNERDYVWVTNFNEGCFSYVGRAGGRQQLSLGPGCMYKTTIIHEFVHAIGFWHEQSRQDRDKWINVQWKNIPRKFWREFQTHSGLNDFGTEYDYRSVMHYSYNAFAWDSSKPTITTKRRFPLRQLGTGDSNGGLTATDALQINKMYNCPRYGG